MDGLELRQTLMQALAAGMKALAEERKTANGSYHAELVGRMDATRNVLEFLVNAQVDPCPGADDNAKQEKKDPGPPVDGGSEEAPPSTEETKKLEKPTLKRGKQ